MQAAIQGDDELDVLLRATVAALGCQLLSSRRRVSVTECASNSVLATTRRGRACITITIKQLKYSDR